MASSCCKSLKSWCSERGSCFLSAEVFPIEVTHQPPHGTSRPHHTMHASPFPGRWKRGCQLTFGDAAAHGGLQLLQLGDGVAEGQAPPGGRAFAQVARMPQAGVPPAQPVCQVFRCCAPEGASSRRPCSRNRLARRQMLLGSRMSLSLAERRSMHGSRNSRHDLFLG